ncbi:hypothetical protein OIU85_000209 [Salix viminalis]|uniref:Alpha-L-arabinofuranosidase C-terminal domain-containing protein n=1 Tax=Salix viminalis TaxID=40686 RepID=A0A9Q0ZWW1_SALVM|nr:hypothetical protein OIU85_000209 [Salix viminalis]
MGFTIFEASVSDYAVSGNDAGTGSLLAALADTGLLIGLERNRWNPDAIVFNSSKHRGTLSYWVQKLFRESSGATLLDAKLQTNSSTLVASAITWQNSDGETCLKIKIVNFGNSDVNLKVSNDGLGLSSQLSVSAKTVLTSSNIMDENSFTDPKKNLSIPVYVANLLAALASSRNAGGAHTMLENVDKDMDVVVSPYSLNFI